MGGSPENTLSGINGMKLEAYSALNPSESMARQVMLNPSKLWVKKKHVHILDFHTLSSFIMLFFF